jgi:hypothetical protein
MPTSYRSFANPAETPPVGAPRRRSGMQYRSAFGRSQCWLHSVSCRICNRQSYGSSRPPFPRTVAGLIRFASVLFASQAFEPTPHRRNRVAQSRAGESWLVTLLSHFARALRTAALSPSAAPPSRVSNTTSLAPRGLWPEHAIRFRSTIRYFVPRCETLPLLGAVGCGASPILPQVSP